MRTSVITAHDPAWDGYLARLPGSDIYHTSAYHRAHQANGDGTALAFVAEDDENVLFYPYMLRFIPGTEYKDIETVYGYSGPLCSAPWAWFLGPAWHIFGEICRQNNIVAEFVRFNPLSGNFLLHESKPILDRETVVLDLSGNLLERAEGRHRNAIRKARNAGCVISESVCFSDFWRLYDATMERNHASDYYRFSPAYRERLFPELGKTVTLLNAWHAGRVVASAIFLTHGDRMHYHLAGSDDFGRSIGASNWLLAYAASLAQVLGYRWLHLGGGRTNAPDDSLLRFKASVSRERRPFYVGRRIHNEAAYRELCEDWRRRHPGESGDYFLLWRKG